MACNSNSRSLSILWHGLLDSRKQSSRNNICIYMMFYDRLYTNNLHRNSAGVLPTHIADGWLRVVWLFIDDMWMRDFLALCWRTPASDHFLYRVFQLSYKSFSQLFLSTWYLMLRTKMGRMPCTFRTLSIIAPEKCYPMPLYMPQGMIYSDSSCL